MESVLWAIDLIGVVILGIWALRQDKAETQVVGKRKD